MSSRTFNSPWPTQTPVAHVREPPAPSPTPHRRSLKRRRIVDDAFASTSKSMKRQVVADQGAVEKALTDCQFLSGNSVISCFPTADTVVAQHQWVSFVWNSRRPELTNTASGLVDIFLFHGDSRQQILHFPHVPNPKDQAGRINTQVNDSWWGANGVKWHGKNISYPFYWVIIPSEGTLDGNQIAQATFSAVQTTFADAVVASSASAASASSVAATATLTSSLLPSMLSSPLPTSTAAVQQGATSKDFPHWAIAVIVVLGFFAIVASGVLAFLIIRRVRRRTSELDSNRNSMGSASPMMANAGGPSSPLLAGAAIGGNHPASIHAGPDPQAVPRDAPSVVLHDGASTISRTGSAANNEGPFSGQDAAIMAHAFRKMLRQPDFANRPVSEGDSPDGPEDGKEELINRELAEEGRDIRSVSSERGVRVETLSDSGDTVQNRPGGERD